MEEVNYGTPDLQEEIEDIIGMRDGPSFIYFTNIELLYREVCKRTKGRKEEED